MDQGAIDVQPVTGVQDSEEGLAMVYVIQAIVIGHNATPDVREGAIPNADIIQVRIAGEGTINGS